MIQRCTNPNFKQWAHYGGRGITVCDRWRSFENFLADMGRRPQGLTLERENNDRGYEPGNCKWATRLEQRANRRPNPTPRHHVFDAVVDGLHTVAAIAAAVGIRERNVQHHVRALMAEGTLVGRRISTGSWGGCPLYVELAGE
jgi:hypothetical protein